MPQKKNYRHTNTLFRESETQNRSSTDRKTKTKTQFVFKLKNKNPESKNQEKILYDFDLIVRKKKNTV